jgi:hypothetical protein
VAKYILAEMAHQIQVWDNRTGPEKSESQEVENYARASPDLRCPGYEQTAAGIEKTAPSPSDPTMPGVADSYRPESG